MTTDATPQIKRPRVLPLLTTCALALVATACGSNANSAGEPTPSSDGEAIPVVTVSDVYKDIVSAVGGNEVSVTALISKLNQNPHAYEDSPSDKMAVSKARLRIENGGGYDDFFEKLGRKDGTTINVVDLSGLRPEGAKEFNEHVWYHFPTMSKLADKVASELSSIKKESASAFASRAEKFKGELDQLDGKLETLKGKADGQGVIVTEPVPLYLLERAGFKDQTPEGLSEAIEADNEVPASVMEETRALITDKKVRLLANNSQTETTQTNSLVEDAKKAPVPIVNFTETLPKDESYIDWMNDNISAVQKALGE